MSIPVEIKKLPKSEVEITGEMPAEDFSRYWLRAVKEISNEVAIPGFRTGNIPEKVLAERVGEKAILDKAAELAIRKLYPDIVEEHSLDIIGHPHAIITKIAKSAPLGFKITTAILPEITLPENFKEISRKIMEKKEEIKVEDKEINDTLEQLRKMRAKKDESGAEQLPELNDEFAKDIGKFNTLDELKNTLKENLLSEKTAKAKEKKRLESLEGIVKETKMEIPDILVEGEKFKMLEEFKSSITGMGLKWEDYLAHLKKSEEEVLNGWAESALKRVQYGLTLKKLGDDIKVEITDAEIEERIKELTLREQAGIDIERLKNYAYGIIRNEKVFSVLEGGENKTNKE